MIDYRIHTVETAPEASKPILETVKKNFGFVPNLMATMSESPVLVESYLTMMRLFEKAKLSPTEREIILMTNNRLNGCTYCMAAHSTVAKMAGVDAGVIEALRSGTSIDDPKLEALRTFAVIIHETHGRPTEQQVDEFLAAGYTKETILEVIVGTSLKVLSNYTTPITVPELDKAFEPMAWSKEGASA
ncbi:carboxymuconolactone decarboxylase family protein [Rubellicoccus peritrichatus]|uniref:Carboxymuconolactone decarboxylase family protein n=1 Tax=Rubellicoccus peritrichatus TaxID=3080537 RepID=A0AAQ3QU99_9BACT|nr:carboxymuconolactone decarboxylase family protein [Puniceicoccus sp. CR14]WOO40248.1 carboxymuconolactone decarboxylase family protein [Puniceicoccus sp. CR14]